jgi:hypothetical protein
VNQPDFFPASNSHPRASLLAGSNSIDRFHAARAIVSDQNELLFEPDPQGGGFGRVQFIPETMAKTDKIFLQRRFFSSFSSKEKDENFGLILSAIISNLPTRQQGRILSKETRR